MGDGDELEEVDVQVVWLGAVGLPVEVHGGRAEGRDAAGGLVGADGPGGEGGDVFEVGWEGAIGRIWRGMLDVEVCGSDEHGAARIVPASTGGGGMVGESL